MGLNYRREYAASACLVLFGAAFSAYAVVYLRIGEFAQMGPGMFPLIVGLVISGLGLLHLLAALAARHRGDRAEAEDRSEPIQWRSLAVVIASLAAFSTIVGPFGVFPAIFALTAIASLGSERLTPTLTLAIATGLSLMAWVIFAWALGLPFKMYDWPL